MAEVVYLFTPMAHHPDTLPNRIREHRKAAGMSLEALGEAVGVTKSAMGLYERGIRPITSDKLRQVAKVLGTSVSDLLAHEDSPFTLSNDERVLVEHYRALSAVGRRTVASVAENLQEWTQPDEDQAAAARRA